MSEEALLSFFRPSNPVMQLPTFISSATGASGANITSTGSLINDFAVANQYRGVSPAPGGFTGFTTIGSQSLGARGVTAGRKFVVSNSEVFTPNANTGGGNLIGWWRGVDLTTGFTENNANGNGTTVNFPSLSWTAGEQRFVILGLTAMQTVTPADITGFTYGPSQNGTDFRMRMASSNVLYTTSFPGASITLPAAVDWFVFSLAVKGIVS